MKRRLALLLTLLFVWANYAATAEDWLETDALEIDELPEQWIEPDDLPEEWIELDDLTEMSDLGIDDRIAEGISTDVAANAAMPAAMPTAMPASDDGLLPIDKRRFPDDRFRKYISKEFDADGDQKLSDAEIAAAVWIDVSGEGISNLQGIGVFTNLEALICRKNKLKDLNLGGCVKLQYLDCHKNRLKTLDVRACTALVELNCANNKLTDLSLKKNTALVRLDCSGNAISKLDIAKLSPRLREMIRSRSGIGWFGGKLSWRDADCYMVISTPVALSDGKEVVLKKNDHLRWRRLSLDRGDYRQLSDAQYANFRNVSTKGMGKRALYRSSHPLSPIINRNNECLAAMNAGGVRTVINMSDNADVAEAFETYPGSCYGRADLWAKKMALDVKSRTFQGEIADICRFMINHDGPYLVHCIWGQDRTGFMCALLECLMGANMNEVVSDYMKTYENYFDIKSGSWEYKQIAKTRIQAQLDKAFPTNKKKNEKNKKKKKHNQETPASLSTRAHDYLIECGLTDDEITQLKKRLAADY